MTVPLAVGSVEAGEADECPADRVGLLDCLIQMQGLVVAVAGGVVVGATEREIAQGHPCSCLLKRRAVGLDGRLGDPDQRWLGVSGEPPVLDQAGYPVGEFRASPRTVETSVVE
jgi:hypothetical protein